MLLALWFLSHSCQNFSIIPLEMFVASWFTISTCVIFICTAFNISTCMSTRVILPTAPLFCWCWLYLWQHCERKGKSCKVFLWSDYLIVCRCLLLSNLHSSVCALFIYLRLFLETHWVGWGLGMPALLAVVRGYSALEAFVRGQLTNLQSTILFICHVICCWQVNPFHSMYILYSYVYSRSQYPSLVCRDHFLSY